MPLLEPTDSRNPITFQTFWFGCWLAVTGIALYLNPSADGHGTHQQLGLSPCPSALILNRPCPGCGLTTSWTALVHGQFERSFESHWLGPFLYLVFTWSAFMALAGIVTKQKFNTDGPIMNRCMIALGVVFFVYGFGRMALVNDFRSPKERMIIENVRHQFGQK
ncbi:Protein of unknown function DUF2752 [Fimbriimonadaceae bacterium]|jgi:hypothetical protein